MLNLGGGGTDGPIAQGEPGSVAEDNSGYIGNQLVSVALLPLFQAEVAIASTVLLSNWKIPVLLKKG